ncbi:hypothetical protein Mapa_007761 [Marchantia paleacea]|nr:hypothetical protein Mapa_007761 [Marchantia paleacea]
MQRHPIPWHAHPCLLASRYARYYCTSATVLYPKLSSRSPLVSSRSFHFNLSIRLEPWRTVSQGVAFLACPLVHSLGGRGRVLPGGREGFPTGPCISHPWSVFRQRVCGRALWIIFWGLSRFL